jgi:hypothetical protein
MLRANQEIFMRLPLLALATAALLSGTVAASAQTSPGGAAPGDQNRDQRAQPADQGRPDNAAPGAMQPGPAQREPTQLKGDTDRTQPQGGEMLRGGEVRGGAAHPLTVEERTNLRETVLRTGPQLTHVSFRIGVGAVVPRTVRLVAVPQPILAIYPAWSGDLFFSYGDEIVVVAPDSMEIVGVLPL